MKTKVLVLGIITSILAMVSCTTNNYSSAVDGPNSIKGTFTGIMIDSSKSFTFNYDYHVTTNDGDSYSEGFIDTYTGDTILYVDQYFYFDRNGYSAGGNTFSASGQYFNIELVAKVSTTKNVTTFTLTNNPYPPCDCNSLYNNFYGMWQTTTANGSRFVYGDVSYYGYQSYNVQPTYSITNLAYDKSSQILSGKMNFSVGNNNDLYVYSGNHNATTITGDFKIYVPKENLEITNNNSNGGFVYRKRAH